eukprot:scaffold108694_cov54-Phaeocystis_antarctica.AAC.2
MRVSPPKSRCVSAGGSGGGGASALSVPGALGAPPPALTHSCRALACLPSSSPTCMAHTLGLGFGFKSGFGLGLPDLLDARVAHTVQRAQL